MNFKSWTLKKSDPKVFYSISTISKIVNSSGKRLSHNLKQIMIYDLLMALRAFKILKTPKLR
jgi:hypothetical protein